MASSKEHYENTMTFEERGERKVNDIIHGFITFNNKIWDFIDTPEFQRLRNIKQLGATSFVFPCAVHTRFEHSIGTAYLCQQYMDRLILNNPVYYNIQKSLSARKTVTLAGLFHDIGHGPFSHMFDNQFIPSLWQLPLPQGVKWKHQVLSSILFEKVVYNNHLQDHISEIQIKRVQDLILGNVDKFQRPWEFQIVNNTKNSLDVDKFDYIRRDAFYLGVKSIYIESELILKNTKILRDKQGQEHLFYNYKYAEKILDVYQSRYKLFKHYYLHKVGHAIELMICDALIALQKNRANSPFHILQTCEDIYKLKDQSIGDMKQQQRKKYFKLLETYQSYTDDILNKIMLYPTKETDIEIKKAQELVKRIVRRKLYKFVMQISFSTHVSRQVISLDNNLIKNKLLNYERSNYSQTRLTEDNIRVYCGTVNFGNSRHDPSKKVQFYNGNEIIGEIDSGMVTLLATERFSQLYIRVYSVVDDETVLQRAQKVFDKIRELEFPQWKKQFIHKKSVLVQNSQVL